MKFESDLVNHSSKVELISIQVNGFPHSVQAGTILLTLLDRIDEPHAAAVVEVNRKFVHKTELQTYVLSDGDSIEVILPAFGG